MTATTTAQQKRVVQDTKGSVYELREEMSREDRVSSTELSTPRP